jgi:hypothetical protein
VRPVPGQLPVGRHHDVQPFAAGRLRPAIEALVGEQLTQAVGVGDGDIDSENPRRINDGDD